MPVWTARVAAPIFGRCMDLVVFLMEGGAEKAFKAKRIGEADDGDRIYRLQRRWGSREESVILILQRSNMIHESNCELRIL